MNCRRLLSLRCLCPLGGPRWRFAGLPRPSSLPFAFFLFPLSSLLFPLSFFLLAGCDEREDNPTPPPSLSGFSAPSNPKSKGKAEAGSDLQPEELKAKQLAKLKEAQEKTIKAQQELLKKQKNKESKEEKEKKGSGPQPIVSGDTRMVEVDREKEARNKGRVKLPVESSSAKPKTVEITGSGRPVPRTSGNTSSLGNADAAKVVENRATISEGKAQEQSQRSIFDRLPLVGKSPPPPRNIQTGAKGEELAIPALPGKKPANNPKPAGRSTDSMDRVMSAVDELQRRQPQPSLVRSSPERHDTVTNQLSEILATSRLRTVTQEQEKEAEPAKRNAEVVELGGKAPAPTPAPENSKPAPRHDAEARPQAPGEGGPAPALDEADVEEKYQAGLASRDVVARQASFQSAAIGRREDAIPYLLEELKQNNLLAAFAVECLGAIGRLTEEVEAAVLHGLSSHEAAVRLACADALGRLGSRRATPPLLEALKTEQNYNVRCAYLAALGCIGDREALPALRAKLAQKDEVEFVKSSAALALARLGDPAGRAHLIRDLEASEPGLQVIGLMGLAQLNEPFLAGYLSTGLESAYEEVWTTAVYLMPRLGPQAALPVLRTRLDSPSEALRRRAALAMGFLGSDEALPYIERGVRVGGLNERAMGCELLADLGRTDKISLLIEKLQDPHTSVRQTAAISLTRLNAKEALPALIEATQGLQNAGDLPPGLRGAGPDAMERLVILSCVRILRGEKEDLIISSLPNRRDNTWPEVDRVVAEQQVELVKMYQFVDVVADGPRALGVILKLPEGKEIMFREGEHVASGFKVREIGLPAEGKDKTKTSPYAILMRGADRIILAPNRPAEVDIKKPAR